MESSTPIAETSVRRLLKNPTNLISPLEKNNDETERNKRRSNAINLRRMSQISIASSNESPIVNNAQHLNKKQVLDTLNKWQKMYAENKITKQNVWNLHVVDYMRRYLGMQSPDTGNMAMLKFASSALDVSTKVYGLRVDCVYETSMKLASRINRICAKGDVGSVSDAEDAEDNGDDGHQNVSGKKTKKRKRRFPKATIAKDDTELFGPFPQIETGMFNTQTQIKNSMVENLFSSRLPLSKSGTTMKLLNNECAWRRATDIDPLVSDPLVHKTYIYDILQLPSKTLPPLCPELQKFVIDEWDPDQAEISHRSLEEVIYDKEGFPVPELDATLTNANEDFENGGGVYNDSEDEDVVGQILTDEMAQNREVAFVVDFNPDNSNLLFVNEYSYINNLSNVNRQLSQIWAGPSHWKLKTLKRSVARYTGKQDDKQENKRARRPKREEENITFLGAIPDVLLNTQCKSRKSAQIAEKDKLHFSLLNPEVIMLYKMLSKCSSVISRFKKDKVTEKPINDGENPNNSAHMDDNVDDGLDDYDHNNLNNSQYCSQTAIPDDDIDQNCGNFLENNLVDKPDMVIQSHLSYQTHAKKIDMRKLKKAIWGCLTNVSADDTHAKVMGTASFRDIINKIPAKLSSQARSELTCHTVFVALLHLANEHCLSLENNGDDIEISQG